MNRNDTQNGNKKRMKIPKLMIKLTATYHTRTYQLNKKKKVYNNKPDTVNEVKGKKEIQHKLV
jgi:hypothetical protein